MAPYKRGSFKNWSPPQLEMADPDIHSCCRAGRRCQWYCHCDCAYASTIRKNNGYAFIAGSFAYYTTRTVINTGPLSDVNTDTDANANAYTDTHSDALTDSLANIVL